MALALRCDISIGFSAGVFYWIVGLLAGGILVGGLVFCWLAAKAALQMPLLDAIRRE